MWLRHPDYPNNLFSPEGEMLNIHSLVTTTGTLLIPRGRKDGYSVVHIRNKRNKWVTRRLHRIIAEIYCENKWNKKQVNHIDGNKQNNRFKNLEFCTNKENAIHSVKIGLTARGEKLSELSENNIRDIIEKAKKGKTHGDIAKDYLISGTAVQGILSGRTWTHITGISAEKHTPNPKYSSKLNKEKAREIKKMLLYNHSVCNRKKIAETYKVSLCSVNDIYKERTWRNV